MHKPYRTCTNIGWAHENFCQARKFLEPRADGHVNQMLNVKPCELQQFCTKVLARLISHLNIKMPSHWYRNSHYKDKMVSWLSYLYNGNPYTRKEVFYFALQWCHNERNGVSNHWHLDCLFNCLFRHRPKKTSKLCVTGLCERNSPVTSEFLAQRASNMDNVSIGRSHYIETGQVTAWAYSE